MRNSEGSTRRQFLGVAGTAAAIGTIPVVSLRPVSATPETMTAAIRNVIGSAVVRTGKVYLGPRAGRGQISTRIRLADSQKITAIARLSDDSLWSATADVVVTLAACTEEVI